MDKVTYEQALEALKTVKAFCDQTDGDDCFNNECELDALCSNIRNNLPCDWKLEEAQHG